MMSQKKFSTYILFFLIFFNISIIINAQQDQNETCNGSCACVLGCDCIPQPDYSPPPICPDSDLTLQDGVKVGFKFAPVLYHHPLEWSHLVDPLEWLEDATLFDPVRKENTSFEEMNLENDSWTDWTQVLPRTWMSVLSNENSTGIKDVNEELIFGSPFDNGTSTANVYFTVFEQDNYRIFKHHNAWIFTYHLFYPLKGCKNGFISVISEGQYRGNAYFRCPEDVQEGDWERVTVFVCKKNQKIQQIQYSQHDWITQYQCPNGKCPNMENITHEYDDNSTEVVEHPVTFSALFSHANYPFQSDFWMYAKLKLEFIANLDGLYSVDRTRADNNKKFVPNSENVIYLPRAELMTFEDKYLSRKYEWGLYTGRWGAHGITAKKKSITCFDENITRIEKCDINSTFGKLLKQFLGPEDYIEEIEWTIEISQNKTTSIAQNQGPLTRDYTYLYTLRSEAPLWKNHDTPQDVLCPYQRYNLSDYETVPKGFNRVSLEKFIWGMVTGILVVGVLLLLVLLAPLFFRKKKSIQKYQLILPQENEHDMHNMHHETHGMHRETHEMHRDMRNMREMQREMHVQYRNINIIVYWIVLALAQYVVGVVLIAIGIDDLFGALKNLTDIEIWRDIRNAFIVLLVVLGFLDFIILQIAILLQTSQHVEFFGLKIRNLFLMECFLKRAWQMHALCAGLLVIEVNVSLVLFGFGFMVWCGRYALSVACSLLYSLVEGEGVGDICLDLQNVGLGIFCGEDVARFCVEWNNLRLQYIIWGSFPLLLSHLIFIVVAIVNYCDARNSSVKVNITDQSDENDAPIQESKRQLIVPKENEMDPNIFDPSVSQRD